MKLIRKINNYKIYSHSKCKYTISVSNCANALYNILYIGCLSRQTVEYEKEWNSKVIQYYRKQIITKNGDIALLILYEKYFWTKYLVKVKKLKS